MAEALQHLQLIVHHLVIALHILLQNDLDSNLPIRRICFPDNAICASS